MRNISRRKSVFGVFLGISLSIAAQNVTLRASNEPVADVFRALIEQTGKNFIYSSDLLKGLVVTVNIRDLPLEKALDEIFRSTDIEYVIKGKNVILKKKAKQADPVKPIHSQPSRLQHSPEAKDWSRILNEVVVVSRLESPSVESAEIGAKKITGEDIRRMPVMFGESDVVKSIQKLPGVVEGVEGIAGMYVHGGNSDENLYMLDNVPLYQVNHFAGMFSAFNTDIIRYIDFFKTSIPAKYDGRLSSFLDVRLQNGYDTGHHGSARLGLTSGAFNISGPIGEKTTYLLGLRRSWYDVLTIPMIALVNSKSPDEKMRFRYYFMDLNGKLNHRFSSRINGFVSVYYGSDLLKTGSKDLNQYTTGWFEDDRYDFNWGNLVVQAGLNYRITHNLSAEFTAAFTRYFSTMKHNDLYKEFEHGELTLMTHTKARTVNNISDWIARADFDWSISNNSRLRFGANYIRHSFLPAKSTRKFITNDSSTELKDSTWTYGGNEINLYAEDEWRPTDVFTLNVGLHGSLFQLGKKVNGGLSPRLSLGYRIGSQFAIKGAYARTVQYVHQISQSYLSLPTDQWIPITGNFKPMHADKVSLGGYWNAPSGTFSASIEGYLKQMYNLLEYKEEYYIHSPVDLWNSRLTSGKGRAYGIDLLIEKTTGKFTGHVSYSLAWADRRFKEKNNGKSYPARFDNRHTINISANWNISDKVTLGASWIGHSGNRFTLLPQLFDSPGLGNAAIVNGGEGVPLKASINNYQLPFYHRLDLSCNVKNKHGYWNFSLYNAYCHMNTVAIRRNYIDEVVPTHNGLQYTSKPVFQKVKLLPIIPSISYTWQF